MTAAAALMKVDIAAALPQKARQRLAAETRLLDLDAGETSDGLGAPGLILFLLEGALRVSSGTGATIAFTDLAPGAAAGLAEAVCGAPAGPRAILALESSRALVVPAASFFAAVQASGPAAFALARRFGETLAVASASADPLQRVYRDLLQATRPFGERRWTVDPLPRHRELAERTGVAEEDAAAAIAHLLRLGVARRRYPALDIEDRDALRALAG